MLDQFVVALLPVAAGFGWFYRNQTLKTSQRETPSPSKQYYFSGLNHVINEEQDKAIDAFVKLIQIEEGTFETHLVLGNLFRRRGELDRAIRVHQNLIVRGDLPASTRMMSYVALIKDYFEAGVFDRAEQLCLQLIDEKEFNSEVLNLLLRIYQTEKKWLKAIEIARRLQQSFSRHLSVEISYYFAELAHEMYQLGQYQKMTAFFSQALEEDPNCVRVHYLLVLINVQKKDFTNIISSCGYLESHAPDLLCYLFQLLIDNESYIEVELHKEIIAYMNGVIANYPYLFFLLTSQSLVDVEFLTTDTLRVVYNYNRDKNSLEMIHYFLCYQQLNATGDAYLQALNLRKISNKLISGNLFHQCTYCGFRLNELFWCCKGCHRWATATRRMLILINDESKEG